MKTEIVNVSDLKRGDTVLLDGEMKTIGRESIKNGFCGHTLNGERMASVKRVLFPRFRSGKITNYITQP